MGSLKPFRALADIETDWGLVRDPTVPSRDQLTHSMPWSLVRLHLTPDPGLLIDVSVRAVSHLIGSKTQAFPSLQGIHLAHTRLLPVTKTELFLKSKDHNMCITFDGSVNPDVKRMNYLETRYVVGDVLL